MVDIYNLFYKYATTTIETTEEENPFEMQSEEQPADALIDKLKKYQIKGPKLPDDFWTEFIAVSKRLGIDPEELAKVISSESGFYTGSIARNEDGNPIAKGLNQMTLIAANAIKMPIKKWNNYETLSAKEQLMWLEKFMSVKNIKGLSAVDIYIKNFGSHNNPDGSMYASLAYINAHPLRDKFLNPELQDIQYNANKNIDLIYGNKDGAISRSDMEAFLKGSSKF